ncbi:MAG: RNA-binding protein [Dehalococcoidia bacterium]
MVPEFAESGSLMQIRIDRLPDAATEQEIRAIFLPHGPVHFFSRPINEMTHRQGPTAYLEMATTDGAAALKAVKGTRLGGQALSISEATPLAPWAPDATRLPHSPVRGRTVTAPSTLADLKRSNPGDALE